MQTMKTIGSQEEFHCDGNDGDQVSNSTKTGGSLKRTPTIIKIFESNTEWVQKRLSSDDDYFDNLAAGQTPEILYFGCSDSRVTAEEIMGLNPGDAFVHRNIANMVCALDLSAEATIEYAVNHLKVKHIVVCGHYNCGGVKAAMTSADLGILNPYLRQIRDVYRTHKHELNDIEDDSERYNRLVQLNVEEQCLNVLKTAVVQQAFTRGELHVHGWVFDLNTGKLIDTKVDCDRLMKEIKEIYNITS